MPGGRPPLRSGVLANLRASPRYLLTNGRRCYTEGKYEGSARCSLTTSTERDPLGRLTELTNEPPRFHLLLGSWVNKHWMNASKLAWWHHVPVLTVPPTEEETVNAAVG